MDLAFTIRGRQSANIPLEDRKLDPPHSAFKARTYPNTTRSPYYLRKKKSPSYRSCCSLADEPTRDGRDNPADGSGDGPESINTPRKRGSINRSRGEHQGRCTQDASSTGNQRRQYCTQGCLLGLVWGSTLDQKCPNVKLHRQGETGTLHLLSNQKFCAMVKRQLAADLDRNCTDLKLQGSRGRLFQITLASHGYTFVGKGTRDVFVSDLRHEGRMYDRLRSFQGKKVPVYLGNIDLEQPWLDLGVRIIHMLLLSWGGERVDKFKGVKNLEMEVKRFESEVARLGVQHGDLRRPNMLWNEEVDGVMFIDLERATEIPTRTLQEFSVNQKRKRRNSSAEKVTAFLDDSSIGSLSLDVGSSRVVKA